MDYETIEILHEYIAVLRCRTWCEWPSWQRFMSDAYRDPIRTESGAAIYLNFHVHTYKERQRPESSPPRKLAKDAGPILWRGTMAAGYWLGDMFISAERGFPARIPADQGRRSVSSFCVYGRIHVEESTTLLAERPRWPILAGPFAEAAGGHVLIAALLG